jgi:hypothetical protein
MFQQADHDHNGTLDVDEFWGVLNSKSLNLKLSQAEMKAILDAADVDKDGVITYNEFVPVAKQLLAMVYQVCCRHGVLELSIFNLLALIVIGQRR